MGGCCCEGIYVPTLLWNYIKLIPLKSALVRRCTLGFGMQISTLTLVTCHGQKDLVCKALDPFSGLQFYPTVTTQHKLQLSVFVLQPVYTEMDILLLLSLIKLFLGKSFKIALHLIKIQKSHPTLNLPSHPSSVHKQHMSVYVATRLTAQVHYAALEVLWAAPSPRGDSLTDTPQSVLIL